MRRFYETFRKEKSQVSSSLRPEYHNVYEAVAHQRTLIQSKKKHFDSDMTKLGTPKDSAAKARVQALKLGVGRAMLACEEELRRGEEMLQELLRAESIAAAAAAAEEEKGQDCYYYLPVTQAVDQEVTRIIAEVNQEIEQARRTIRDINRAVEAEPRPRKTVKMEATGTAARESRVSVYEMPQHGASSDGDLMGAGARLSKRPRVMRPRVKKLAKPEPLERTKMRRSVVIARNQQEEEAEEESRTDRVTKLH